jgi:hypothetical protein
MRTILKTVLVAAVLGTSALASAAPCNDGNTNTPVTVTVTQQLAPVITHPIVYPHQGWVNLGGMRVDGKDTIEVGAARGRFEKIELVRNGGEGETKVNRVEITFGDGQVQTVRLDRRLTDRDNALQIGLVGGERGIRNVTVIGSSYGRSGIQVRGLEA